MQRQESRSDTQVPGRGTAESEAAPATPGRGGGGSGALPAELRGKMEAAFGADFSAVRIHEGAHVAALGAQAYTQGTDIHFAPGRYQPDSAAGQELLGHELAHVVQQASGRVSGAQARGGAIATDLGLEREADDHGARAARGERIGGAPGKLLAIDGRAGGPVQRKELSPGELASTMHDKLDRDVPVGLAMMTGGALDSERALLEDGLNDARLTYLEQCERLRSNAPIIGAQIPPADKLTLFVIQDFAAAIESCPEIGDSMASDHWLGHEKLELEKGNTKETFCERRHVAERKKSAGAWAQAALPVAELLSRLAQLSSTDMKEQLSRKTDREQRRDLQGRLGFLLTSTSTSDLLPNMLNVDAHDDTSRPQGAGGLAQRLPGVFSTAACHADARRYCDLLSAGLAAGPTAATVTSGGEVNDLVGAVSSAVTSCTAAVKLLKLTVEDNHSVLYVIGDGGATRLETVAAPDSRTILINDLIRGQCQSTSNVLAAVDAGVRGLCKIDDKPVTLKFEVHAAATMEAIEQRVDDQLRESMAQLTLGLTIGSWAMADLYERQRQALLHKKQPEQMSDHGVAPVIPRDRMCLPRSCATGGNLTFFALDSAAQVAAPVAGTTYRLACQGSWLRVTVAEVIEAGKPAWLYPMLALHVTRVDRSLADPEVAEPRSHDDDNNNNHNRDRSEDRSEARTEDTVPVPPREPRTLMLAMCNGYKKESGAFIPQTEAREDLDGVILINDQGRWQVSDPLGRDPLGRKATRKITLTPI